MKLEIDEPLEAEAPNFDLLPYLMITYIATQVDFDWARSLRHSVVSGMARLSHLFFFEDKEKLAGVHDWIQFSQGLTFPIGPQDVENATNNAA